MKRYFAAVIMTIFCLSASFAQSSLTGVGGSCGEDTKWNFDGYTLKITKVVRKNDLGSVYMDDYSLTKKVAPWIKKKLDVKRVVIGEGIKRIGSCAFANCRDIQEVVFESADLQEIGWGAFLNCKQLRNISLPVGLLSIETIAFANCSSLVSVKLPEKCRVGDQAYVSCSNLNSIEVSPTTILGHYVFASEVKTGDRVRHSLYNGEIIRLPAYINVNNCNEYGFAKAAVEKITDKMVLKVDYDYATSEVDKDIPNGLYTRQNTYVLIFGNQNYRFVSKVPYAIHDARVFAEYCKKTLLIPSENIHISEDATKQMMIEEELEDWLNSIPDRESKYLIVYYAGHGVPDIKNKNKAYILPTDVRGTNPQRGIALEDFYGRLGALAFQQTSVFLDACFSGVNRNNEGVSDGLRAVEIVPEDATFGDGNVVVFSAAQGNETAQGYPEQGHGLFTYFLLKEIRESKGNISYGTLADKITSGVSKQASQLKMRKKQTPTTNASESVSETWRNMQF